MLSDGDVSVAVLDLGAITQSWHVPHQGRRVPVVLGHDDPEAYRHNPWYLGAMIGRLAGRVARARLPLGGQSWRLPANDGANHLHGGPGGLHSRTWRMDPDGTRALRLTLHSDHLDQGYPGALDIALTISLSGFRLSYDIRVTSDRPTPVSLTQHSYYRLGDAPLRDHVLRVPAAAHLPLAGDLVPLGEVAPVAGTALDLREGATLGCADPAGTGLDMCYRLDGRVVRLDAPDGLALTMETDQPCLQLYTGSHLAAPFAPFAGLCLEPQQYPDALNCPAFPVVLCTPDQPWHQVLHVTIAPGGRP